MAGTTTDARVCQLATHRACASERSNATRAEAAAAVAAALTMESSEFDGALRKREVQRPRRRAPALDENDAELVRSSLPLRRARLLISPTTALA